MTKVKVTDVLIDPEIRKHTERILALQGEERQTRKELGRIIAAIESLRRKNSTGICLLGKGIFYYRGLTRMPLHQSRGQYDPIHPSLVVYVSNSLLRWSQ